MSVMYREANPHTVLLVEDNPEIGEELAGLLESAGLHALTARTGAEGISLAADCHPDLVLLDLGLPDMHGREVIPALPVPRPPVIIISAMLDMDERLACFDAGVDDFITKPFHPEETLARIHRTLRHHTRQAGTPDPAPPVLRCGTLELDPLACQIRKDGKPVRVRRKVFGLMKLFLENPGRVFNREDMQREVWGGEFVSENSVWVHMNQVRRLLEDDPRNPRYLDTLPGLGYRFIPDREN